MTRIYLRAVVLVMALFAALLTAAPAQADPASSVSVDPTSDDYSPFAWLGKWSGQDGSNLTQVDLKSRLEQTGMVMSVTPEQYAALTPADIQALTDKWATLFPATTQRVKQQQAKAYASPSVDGHRYAAQWSPVDSDSVAKDLGATSYSALSPGLKSIVQRIATIVTGDFKPPMPDDAWASWMPQRVRASFDARPDTRFDWNTIGVSVNGEQTGAVAECSGSAVTWACKALSSAANTVAETADFLTDPFGWIGGKLAAGTAGMWGWVAGMATAGAAPDLSVAWWIDAYKKAMAIGVILALIILLYQFSLVSRGKISGNELVETMVSYFPAYVAGIVFGPALGQFIVRGSTTLTDGIVSVFDGFSASKTDTAMQAAFEAAGAGKALGGIFVGIFVLIFTVIGVVVLFCSMALQLVAIYLSAAFFPIGFAWLLSVKHRTGSWKIPTLFLILLFGRPAMFFLLGVGLAWLDKSMSFSDEGAQNLANLLAAVSVILVAAFAPLLLLKHAPVSPAGWSTSGGSGTAGGAAGAAAGAGSMLTSLATRRAGRQGSRAGSSAPAKSGVPAAAGASGAAGGSGSQRAAAAGASGPGTARPAGLQRRSAAPGGPPSAAGLRVGQAATGQPAAGAAPAGSPLGKPAAGGRPSPSRPGGSSTPGGPSAPAAAPGGAARGGGGGSVGGGSARGGAGQGGRGSGSASRRWPGAGRRVVPGSNLSARRLVEGADGDQRWDSMS